MKLAAASILLLLASGAPAAAQKGASFKARADAQAEREAREFARCAVRHGARERAEALLDDEPESEASRVAVRGFFAYRAPSCVRLFSTFRLKAPTMRGLIAEQLYLGSYGDARRLTPEPAAIVRDRGRPELLRYRVAECAALRDPADADALVRAARLSRDEAAAMNRLLPALRACGQGAKIDYSGTAIHGLLAESLFKMRRMHERAEGTN